VSLFPTPDFTEQPATLCTVCRAGRNCERRHSGTARGVLEVTCIKGVIQYA
jgi:hypothetical protein